MPPFPTRTRREKSAHPQPHGADGIELVWAVISLARVWAEWRDGEGHFGVSNTESYGLRPQGDEILRVRPEGLTPGRKYEVRAITESADRKMREESP